MPSIFHSTLQLYRRVNIHYQCIFSRRFVDKIKIEVKGGKGGNGCISYEVLSPGVKRPSGGNGGAGGDVFIEVDHNRSDLSFDTIHFNGGKGMNGGSNGLTGKRGKDVYIKVPPGTTVQETFEDLFFEHEESDQTFFEEPENEIVLLDDTKTKLLVACGGKPGLGNVSFSGTSHRRHRSVPETLLPGQEGERRTLMLELKVIADVGLVGYPNAGKSSLLRVLSNATPEVAPYPFTTLHPSVGVVEYSDLERITVADIPGSLWINKFEFFDLTCEPISAGLIEGAHEDRGLGHEFLKHIERTKVLLIVLDSAGTEDRQPGNDLKVLLKELKLYNPSLLSDRPAVVFCNKFDLPVAPEAEEKIRKISRRHRLKILKGSAESGLGIPELAIELRKLVEVSKHVNPVSTEDDMETEKPVIAAV